MKDPVIKFLPEAERRRIEARIGESERATRAEIVVMVVGASHHYPAAGWLGAAAFALPLSVALTRFLAGMWWPGPSDLWIFLGVLFPLFLLCRIAVERIRPLMRLFIPVKEMEHEVREAATLRFYENGLHRTCGETGVLIYLSVFEGKVWVLGDRGITALVPAGFWEELVGLIVAGIGEGRPADAICRCVDKIESLLIEKLPAARDDVNELPDLIIEGEPGEPTAGS
jgi:putative membrane protein